MSIAVYAAGCCCQMLELGCANHFLLSRVYARAMAFKEFEHTTVPCLLDALKSSGIERVILDRRPTTKQVYSVMVFEFGVIPLEMQNERF